jgi:hypothetical protein
VISFLLGVLLRTVVVRVLDANIAEVEVAVVAVVFAFYRALDRGEKTTAHAWLAFEEGRSDPGMVMWLHQPR